MMLRIRQCYTAWLGLLFALAGCAVAFADDPLPSWADGTAKRVIVEFVRATTDKGSAKFVPGEERVATFDEDGTTWVEHPMYTEIVFSCDRLVQLAPRHPEWRDDSVFRPIIAHDP